VPRKAFGFLTPVQQFNKIGEIGQPDVTEEGEILKPRKKIIVASFGPPRDASRDSQKLKSKAIQSSVEARHETSDRLRWKRHHKDVSRVQSHSKGNDNFET
jgi:hypothetical protein